MHFTLRKASFFITDQGKIFYFQEALSTAERPIVVDLHMLVTEGWDLQRLLSADERLLAFAKNLYRLPFLRYTVFSGTVASGACSKKGRPGMTHGHAWKFSNV